MKYWTNINWINILVIVLAIIIIAFVTRVVIAGNEGHIDFNCSDFTTQQQAQNIFKKNEKDIYRLDGDKDGIACEGLPKFDK